MTRRMPHEFRDAVVAGSAGVRLTIPRMPSQILWSFEDLAAVTNVICRSGYRLRDRHDELRD